MSIAETNGRLSAVPGLQGVPGHKRARAGRGVGLPLMLTLAVAIPLFGGTAAAGGWAWYHFGSRAAAIAFLQGRSLLLEPRPFDLATINPREKRLLRFKAVNITGSPITIHGVEGFCAHRDGCIYCPDQFPLVVQPRASRALTIEYEYKGQPEARTIHLTTEAFTEIGNFEIALEGKIDGGAAHAGP
jgi:hypothetical protein